MFFPDISSNSIFFVIIVDVLGIDLLRLLAGVNCRIVKPLFGPLLLAAQP